MRKCKHLLLISRIFAASIIISLLVLFLNSCGEKKSCAELMESFSEKSGVKGIIYSPDIPEESDGYVYEGFFELMYSYENTFAEDFAVLLIPRSDAPGECAVFKLYSASDAALCRAVLEKRISLLTSLFGAEGVRLPKDSFMITRGRTVVMCAMENAEEAKEIWQDILDFS